MAKKTEAAQPAKKTEDSRPAKKTKPARPTREQTADLIERSAADLPYKVEVEGDDRGYHLTLAELSEPQARNVVKALRQYGPMILG